MPLNLDKVPDAIRYLLPLAERWGIGDDIYREQAVQDASTEELEQLVSTIQDMPTDELFDWLGGPEAKTPKPSQEYLALTCLTMAYDSARATLKRRKQQT